MDTRDPQQKYGYDEESYDRYEPPGLGAWIHRNTWFLVRLFTVAVFTFGASLTAANFTYGLQAKPIQLTAEQLNKGQLPPGAQLGDYVEVRGTPDYGKNFKSYGTPESKIAVSARYEVAYFYFGLKETKGNLLVQTSKGSPGANGQGAPDINNRGERVWKGKLSNIESVIFPSTTHKGLTQASLPTKASVPVIETGDTPSYNRKLFPAYTAIISVWLLSVAWLLWKKNQPFLGA